MPMLAVHIFFRDGVCVAVAVLELSVPPRPDKAPFQGDASFQNYILVEKYSLIHLKITFRISV